MPVAPLIPARIRNVAAQCHRILKSIQDGTDGNYVAVLQGRRVARREIHVHFAALGMLIDSLDAGMRSSGDVCHSARQGDRLAETLLSAQFKDGWRGHASEHSDLGSDIGDEDDVTWLKTDVFALVAVEQEVVQIEVGDGLAAALNLDVAQTALGKWPPGSEEGVEQRTE